MTYKPLGRGMDDAGWLQIWRERAIGIVLAAVAVLLALGLFAHQVPDSSQALGTIARLAEGLRPALLMLAAVLGIGLGWAGARWVGGACVLVALAGLVSIALDYRGRVSPVGQAADLTLVWFNAFNENAVPGETLASAIRDSGADIVALAESTPARRVAGALSDLYPYQDGCTDLPVCGILVLSRLPLADLRNRNLPTGPNRLVSFTVDHPEAGTVPIVLSHLTKPWYQSVAHGEVLRLSQVLREAGEGRLILLGDFNAAPWSRRIRQLELYRNLSHGRWPVATWPARLGPFGVPIDHALVRGDAHITSITPWGADLGSNHRGLRVEIDLGAPS